MKLSTKDLFVLRSVFYMLWDHALECLVGKKDGIQIARIIQIHTVILRREQRAG